MISLIVSKARFLIMIWNQSSFYIKRSMQDDQRSEVWIMLWRFSAELRRVGGAQGLVFQQGSVFVSLLKLFIWINIYRLEIQFLLVGNDWSFEEQASSFKRIGRWRLVVVPAETSDILIHEIAGPRASTCPTCKNLYLLFFFRFRLSFY